jgi:hypothetical protein
MINKYNSIQLWKNPELVFNLDGKGNNEAKNERDHKNFFRNYITKIIFKHEESEWKEKMRKKPKLRNYMYFKSNLRLENYLSTSNFSGRVLMTAIRSGTNKLNIDMGRREKKEEILRICEHCNLGLVEHELHFVVYCPKYSSLRKILFQNISNISNSKWQLESLNGKDKFLILVNGTGDTFQLKIFQEFQTFLVRAFKLREKKV